MIHVAVRIKELVSSNVDAMVHNATDPVKLLKLLRTEIEESIISLQGQMSQATRRHERLTQLAKNQSEQADEWTAKAKSAIDHKREDLARSALLAREDGNARAVQMQAEAVQLADEIQQLSTSIRALVVKHEEAISQIAVLSGNKMGLSTPHNSDEKSAPYFDRIEKLEKRVQFAQANSAAPANSQIETEIAALQRDADITAELAAIKSSSKPAKRKGK